MLLNVEKTGERLPGRGFVGTIRRPRTLTRANSKREYEKFAEELKASLPEIGPTEARRFRISHHEAILLELAEKGEREVAEYLKELFEFEQRIKISSEGTRFLRDEPEYTEFLVEKLIASQRGKQSSSGIYGNGNEASPLLDAALFFESKSRDWWWIAEWLYRKALAIPIGTGNTKQEDDDLKTITLRNYLFGRFLFEKMENPEEAFDYVNEARERCEGTERRYSFKCSVQSQAPIFRQCNALLCKILLALAGKVYRTDPRLALNACEQAYARAIEAEEDQCVLEALDELGKCSLRSDDAKRALDSFSKLLAMAKRTGNAREICNAHKGLAFAYERLNNDTYAEKHLQLFKENAIEHGLLDKLAEAHYHTGEHYLNQGKPEVSSVYLEAALNLYDRLNITPLDRAIQARIVAGVSKGQERIASYLKLILLSGHGDSDATSKLLRWKDRREKFWPEDSENENGPTSEVGSQEEEEKLGRVDSPLSTDT